MNLDNPKTGTYEFVVRVRHRDSPTAYRRISQLREALFQNVKLSPVFTGIYCITPVKQLKNRRSNKRIHEQMTNMVASRGLNGPDPRIEEEVKRMNLSKGDVLILEFSPGHETVLEVIGTEVGDDRIVLHSEVLFNFRDDEKLDQEEGDEILEEQFVTTARPQARHLPKFPNSKSKETMCNQKGGYWKELKPLPLCKRCENKKGKYREQ